MKSESFCVPFKQLEPAAIARLHEVHPGALPISIDWKLEGSRGSAVIWWCPSPQASPKKKRAARKGIVHVAWLPDDDGRQRCLFCHTVIASKQFWPAQAPVLSTRDGMWVMDASDTAAGGWRMCARRGKRVPK